MAAACLIDAWDGRLWEQEQPLAVLLAACDPQQAGRVSSTPTTNEDTLMLEHNTEESPEAQVTPSPTRTPDHHAAMTKKSRPKKRAREEDAVVQMEKLSRQRVREEELIFRRSLTRHKRDDREFWQLLERQRLRRERETARDMQQFSYHVDRMNTDL